MPEDNSNPQATPEALTAESVAQMINQALSGYAAKNEKHLNKMVEGFTTKLNELVPAKPEPKQENQVQDPAVAVLQRQVAELTKSNEEAKVKAASAERENALSKVLGTYSFANEVARETAYKVFASDIKQTNDGEYVIGDQPLAEAVKSRMSALTGLLAPVAVSGSGGSSTSAPSSGGAITLEQIKAAKSPQALKEISERLQRQFAA